MEEEEWDDALLSEIEALETSHLHNHNYGITAKDRPIAATTTSAPSFCINWSCKSCTLQNNSSQAVCQVCGTPRGQIYQTSAASTPVKKTVQARLSFDGTSVSLSQPRHVEHDIGRLEPSPFTVIASDKRSPKIPLSSATTGSKLLLTSKRPGASITTTPTASPLQIPRLAAGEDSFAKTRYLDIVTRSSFPQIDYEAAQHFVYPTNYSIRDYQLTIAEKALYHNTLVSLPTGLGKTLVAAVVMYNYYRWFPSGKIVFMAPTKPLVAQQIKACHEIMGIPLSDTAELQGNVPPTMRRVLWNTRRVFFCTPQSLQNDLRRSICIAEKFVCIVVDEAHRATGNYAYCCVMQEIEAKTPFFRILALSATPGAKFDVIQDVVTNLRISHIESRSADDPDVRKYTHARQEEVIVCHLSAQIMEIKKQFLKFFTPIIQRLLRNQIIQNSDPDKLTSWYVLQAREKFRKSPDYASNRSAESDLALLVSLLHAKSLLTGHGLNSFRDQIINWVEERKIGKMSWSKREMLQSSEFQKLEASLALTADKSSMTASHPKLVKLREVLLEHFRRHAAGESSTRAIVFTQYRASVSEIVALLHPLAPLIIAQPFIGQGASGKAKENKGQSQKVQQDIVRRFRLGESNVLVATCIAEEGLDIGEVDLIVSFDALTSPVRMIQRMGRTGRKRVGKVIILVTEGEEQKKLARSASAAKTVSRALTTFKSRFAYAKCPRMLPTGIYPQLRELEMKIPTFHASQVGGKALSPAIDPNLWQLSDAERAVAMLKYFPPDFFSSSRNKLFPVVVSQPHLLRRQSRSLIRKSVSNRVGYSARSLILQGLVRKIHGVEEILETDFDDEDAKSVVTKEKNELTNFGDFVQRKSNENARGNSRLKFRYKRHRNKANSDSAETDSEISSPRHQSNVLDVAVSGEDSYALMDESIAFCDMHFSPQFADSASQFVTATGVKEKQPKGCNEYRLDELVTTFMTEKYKSNSSIQKPTQALGSSTAFSSLSDDPAREQVTEVVPDAFVGHFSCLKNGGSEEASLSQTLISSRPFSSASKFIYEQEIKKEKDYARDIARASRHRSTRQLKFDEEEVEGYLLDQSQTAELSPVCLAAETQGQIEKNEGCGVENQKSIACSFALIPSATNAMDAGIEVEETSNNDELTKIENSSAALLPSLSNAAGIAPIESCMLLYTASPEKRFTPAEDATDRDEADETIEVNSAVKNLLTCNPGIGERVIDLTEQEIDNTSGKCTKIGKIKKTTPSLKRLLTGSDNVPRQTKQNKRKEADPELGNDRCCSVCLESESYDDDPIVFCDGCDVAVHQFCYGIHVVPSDKWFCAVCTEAHSDGSGAAPSPPRCQLCPHRGGAFKRTACRQWVHVQCFLWIPEFHVEQTKDDLLVLGSLTRIDQDRKTLDCSLCHSRKGYGIIQCAHNRCLTAFHVSCAAFANYRMDQVDTSSSKDSICGTLFLAYCPSHRNITAPCYPQPQITPVVAKSRRCKPPLPTPSATASPSHLLASPPSAEAKRKFKTFRRLKRKYDASQSQMFSQPGAQESPMVTTPPWQKRIRISKKRRELSRVLAAAYIDDTAEVRGGGQDDDDDDEYGDDDRDAADDSFINDSSQLLYSQSAESPENIGNNKSVKTKNSSPNMRAIYARSLLESQSSPLRHRRGERHFGALPSNGIIRACLDEMRSRPEMILALPAPKRASTTLIESDGDDSATEAEPSPCFDLLKTAKALQSVKEVGEDEDDDKADSEMALSTFGLLEAGTPPPSIINAALTTRARRERLTCSFNDSVASVEQPCRDATNSSNELIKKIEANRLKALQKLEDSRRAKFHQQPYQSHYRGSPSDIDPFACESAFQSAGVSTTTTVKVMHEKEAGAASCNQSSSTSPSRGLFSPSQRSNVDLMSLTPDFAEITKWIIFVSSVFASSNIFSKFLSTKNADCTVIVAKSIEADVLLSVRTAVVIMTSQQLHELAFASSAKNSAVNQRVEMLLAMHKKVIVAIVYNGDELPELQRLRRFCNARVIVQPSLAALCVQLHQMARQDRFEGYELPSPSLCRSDFSTVSAKALDANFASRLEFFRSISQLSLDSAISLSFRFKNFSARHVPVLKFNEMHWRRMLPWISETTAKKIRNHVQQNVQH